MVAGESIAYVHSVGLGSDFVSEHAYASVDVVVCDEVGVASAAADVDEVTAGIAMARFYGICPVETG